MFQLSVDSWTVTGNSTTPPWGSVLRCALLCWWVKIKLNLTHIWYFHGGHHVTITRPYHPQHHQTSADPSMNHHSKTWIKECSSSFRYISQLFGATVVVRAGIHWLDKSVFMCFHVLSCSSCSSWAAKCFVIQSCPVFIFRKLQVFRKNLHENNFCVSSRKSSASLEPLVPSPSP